METKCWKFWQVNDFMTILEMKKSETSPSPIHYTQTYESVQNHTIHLEIVDMVINIK